ncbi:MAG: DMT family transporter [Acidimicrobiia bacterium]
MVRVSALIGVVAISFSAIFVRLADVAPVTAALFRAVYALPLLAVIWLLSSDTRSRRLRLMAGLAGLLLAGDMVLWFTSIGLVGAGLSTVVANTQVLWVGVAAWVLHRERPSTTAFVIVPVVLAGVALIGGVGTEDAYGDRPALGTVLALGASVFYAGFLMIFRSASRDRGPTAGPLLDVTIGVALAMAATGWIDPSFSVTPSWPAHGWLIALAVLVHTGGWLLIAAALPRLPALETSVMLLLQPAATIVWAGLIFDERLSSTQWVGVIAVLVGILAAATMGTVRPVGAGTRRDP